MARIKNSLNEVHKRLLAEEVSKKFGTVITHSLQCEKLCEEIIHTTKKNIGSNTIRRFLGILKGEFSTSITTLNILTEYCGYDHWASFTEQADKLKYEPLSIQTEAAFYLNFYKIEMREEGDMNYHNACRNIALRILFNNALLDKLASSLSKNPISQIYFYERFPFIDGLGSDYKKYLKFYLQHKSTEESKIFGNALLFLSAFLCENSKELNTYYSNLQEIQINETMHPFTIARYVGSNILYCYKKNIDNTEWIEQSLKWNRFFLLKKNISFWHFPYYQYMICDYLNLAGEFEDSLTIINSIRQFKNEKYEIEEGYEQGLEIISNISKHKKIGVDFRRQIESTNALNLCNPLFKKFHELQVLCIEHKLLQKGKKKEKKRESITNLINETGFVFFNNYLEE